MTRLRESRKPTQARPATPSEAASTDERPTPSGAGAEAGGAERGDASRESLFLSFANSMCTRDEAKSQLTFESRHACVPDIHVYTTCRIHTIYSPIRHPGDPIGIGAWPTKKNTHATAERVLRNRHAHTGSQLAYQAAFFCHAAHSQVPTIATVVWRRAEADRARPAHANSTFSFSSRTSHVQP